MMGAHQIDLASGSPRMRELVAQMEACPQTATQSVMAHGRSVWDHFCWLHAHLKNGKPVPDWWRLPEWVRQPHLLGKLMPLEVVEEYLIFHDCVINTPPDASTDGDYRPSRLRVKTTMTITDADQDGSPDIRSMIAAATLIRETKPSDVEPDVTFNHEGGIHLSWTGDGWEIEAGVEHDGRFDWVCETKDEVVRQSDGLIRPQDAVVTIQQLLADIVRDRKPMALQSEGVAHV